MIKSLVLAVFTLFFSWIAYASDDIQRIKQKGELVVGLCKINQPPFYYEGSRLSQAVGDVMTEQQVDSTTSLTGIDIDLSRILAKGLNVKLRLVQEAESWDALVGDLEQGKVDIAVSFLSQTPDRATKILYSTPYARIGQALLVSRRMLAEAKKNGAKNLAEVFSAKRNNTILIYEGSAYKEFAKSLFPEANIKAYKTQEDILTALLDNKAIAFIVDEVEIRNLLKEQPELRLKLVTFIMKEGVDLISVGVSRKNQQLFHFINSVLQIKDYNISIENVKF
jgi:polar amino acid transport system substrate-binding protein